MAGAPNTHVCRHPRRTSRRDEANVRTARRAARTAKEQLAFLDAKLGKGRGAKRERERLGRAG